MLAFHCYASFTGVSCASFFLLAWEKEAPPDKERDTLSHRMEIRTRLIYVHVSHAMETKTLSERMGTL